jgi:fused signal recognition particle receptor
MSFWEKLGLGLKKTSANITSGIADIFTKKKLDAATLEELEELLLEALIPSSEAEIVMSPSFMIT